MSIEESQLHHYFQQVQAKKIKLTTAAKLSGMGYRQIKRRWKEFKEKGISGLISKKRGAISNRKLPDSDCQKILDLIRQHYLDCKPLFITEKLQEIHSITVSDETVRKLMIKHHLWFPKKTKAHLHQRRERRECEGELLQADASKHRWFSNNEQCHLHVYVDDATGLIKGAYFAKEETAVGYYKALQPYLESEGVPLNIYCDRRGVFKVNQKGVKKGKGMKGVTQFQRAMAELGVRLIFAYSPEAKGRVERVFRTLQDRLVCELRLRHISTMKEANEYLPSFIKAYNAKFGKAPKNSFNAHRHLSRPEELKYILCFKYIRTLTKNLEVSFKGKIYQIEAEVSEQNSLKRAKVDIIETLAGEIQFEHKGKRLKFKIFGENFAEYITQTKKIETTSVKKNTRTNTPWRNTFSHESKKMPLTDDERRILDLRLEKRIEDARKDNEEILRNMTHLNPCIYDVGSVSTETLSPLS